MRFFARDSYGCPANGAFAPLNRPFFERTATCPFRPAGFPFTHNSNPSRTLSRCPHRAAGRLDGGRLRLLPSINLSKAMKSARFSVAKLTRLVPLLLVPLFFSCKKEDPSASPCQLTTLSSNEGYDLAYAYSPQGAIGRVTARLSPALSYAVDFAYAPDGTVTGTTVKQNGQPFSTQAYRYQNGRLAGMTDTQQDGTMTYAFVRTGEAITRRTATYPDGTQEEVSYDRDAAGNVLSERYKINGVLQFRIACEYATTTLDADEAPGHELEFSFSPQGVSQALKSRNALRKITYLSVEPGGQETPVQSESYQLKANAQGYVQAAERSVGGQTFTAVYAYGNCP